MLRFDRIGRDYGAVRALQDVSIAVRAGEVHALMGENGAGKSTLIRLLSGLEQPSRGGIVLDGAALVLTPAVAEAAGLRILHQEMHVVPALSVAENMHLHRPFPRRFGLVDWRALARSAAAALERLGLTHIDPRVPMLRLSPGDRMLTRIAATLTGGGATPRLYVMDEPTAAMGQDDAERLFIVISDLVAAGAGVLYVSHRMADVTRLADRVTVLRDGAHVSTRPMADTTPDRIIADMTGRPPSALFPARRAAPQRAPRLSVTGLRTRDLHDITFDLAPGEVLGVAGLAGSGRGALLRALMGDGQVRAGRVVLDGQDMAMRTPADGWAAGLAYVPRERRGDGLMMRRPVSENVVLPHLSAVARAALFRSRPRADRLAAHHTADVRLQSAGPHVACDTLSGGNQQKVLFARALAGDPSVLILDDPTRGVDVGAKQDIYRLIRDRVDAGLGVLVASSDLTELIGLCDRILVLSGGRATRTVPAAGLSEAELLSLCYAGTRAA